MIVSELSERVSELRRQVAEIGKLTNEQWMEGLASRKLKELEFHDAHRDRTAKSEKLDQDTYEKFYGNKKYYSATDSSRQYTRNWIERYAKGAIFLDYACGDGTNAIAGAKAGAELSLGLDISPISVQNATKDAAAAGVGGNTLFFQADCENTRLPDASVDTVICSGMLHHLDLSYAFPELRRILRPGGRILAVEALDYNPAIKLYRMRTPEMRTDWEKAHILSLKDVRFGQRFFNIGEVQFWHILGIAAPHVGPFAGLLHSVDSVLTKVPFVQRMAWIFTFELIRPTSA
jgi:ubiquinone/menaquinone biosynthesis C-methylase UbiE